MILFRAAVAALVAAVLISFLNMRKISSLLFGASSIRKISSSSITVAVTAAAAATGVSPRASWSAC